MLPKYIILHHTATPRDTTTLKGIDNGHKSKNWGTPKGPVYADKSSLGYYVQYHYFIDSKGVATQCRKDTEIGWHASEMNNQSLGICLAGWFDDGHDSLPTDKQAESLAKVLKEKMDKWDIPLNRVKFHRDYANKTCPGLHITKEWVTALLEPKKKLKKSPKKKASKKKKKKK